MFETYLGRLSLLSSKNNKNTQKGNNSFLSLRLQGLEDSGMIMIANPTKNLGNFGSFAS